MDIRSLASQTDINDTVLIAAFAGTNERRWKKLQKYHYYHKVFGKGVICDIEVSPKELYIWLDFEKPYDGKTRRQFINSAFENGFFEIVESVDESIELKSYRDGMQATLVDERTRIEKEEEEKKKEEERKAEIREQMRIRRLEQERAKKEEAEKQARYQEELRIRREEENKQREREVADRVHFRNLRKKYLIERFSDTSPSSPLFMILLKLENGEILDRDEMKWLDVNRAYPVLAMIYEKRANQPDSNGWDAVLAGKYWRKANDPGRALEITRGINSNDLKLKSAILVNRGGTYRDLQNLEEAEKCGLEALKIAPRDYYAHNLLGAVCYQKGEPEKGDAHFEKAVQFGSIPQDKMEDIIDEERKNSVKLANIETQIKVALYLITKDPIKYKWAEFYLPKE